MERSAAISRLRKLLGKQVGYRVNPKAATGDERLAAREALPSLTETKKYAEEALSSRRRTILNADQEYQRLAAAYKSAQDALEKTSSRLHSFKFTVGISSGMFFCVRAEGDSWEEVITKIEKGDIT